MKKQQVIIVCLSIFFVSHLSQACFFTTEFCYEATLVNNERIVVGTISNSMSNSVELNIISVLYGIENSSNITIWDGATIECTGYWPNNANDLGSIGDTVLCLIEPITSIENPWDIIGEYRRPSLLGGYTTYTNFSVGNLFDFTYTYDDILSLDIANYCCSRLDGLFTVNISGLPGNTGSSTPIALTGWPEGGTFSGSGIVFNAFNPIIAGPGNHTITYTINDEFGCSFSTQEDIFVFTITFNFVNYNLGIISPKISNEINIEVEVTERDLYIFQVYDMKGKLLSQLDEQLELGIHQEEIKLNEQLPKGIYLLKVANSQTQRIKKFVVQN